VDTNLSMHVLLALLRRSLAYNLSTVAEIALSPHL